MKLKHNVRGLIRSFSYASKGLRYCIKSERNLRIHIVMTAAVIFLSCFYDFSRAEMCILALAVGFVISTELMNTAAEYTVDHISQAYSTYAKIIKDVAAGAVLVSALTAAAVGIILFSDMDGIMRVHSFFADSPQYIAVLMLCVIPALIFIFDGTAFINRLKNNKGRKHD